VTRPEYLHTAVKAVVYNQVVGHADTMGLHGVTLSIVVVSNFAVVKIGHATRIGRWHGIKVTRISGGCK